MGPVYMKLAAANHDGKRLCVGLDPNRENIAKAWGMSSWGSDDTRLYEWGRHIMDATSIHAAAYKANLAFWARSPRTLRWLFKHIKETCSEIPLILDAKNGDIESTGTEWAEFALYVGADAVTVNPYMGVADVTAPFLSAGLDCFVLAATSNPGAGQLQQVHLYTGTETVSERVARTVQEANNSALGLVAGARNSAALAITAACAPHSMLLIPGVGKQGGDVLAVLEVLKYHKAPGIVNVGRGICEPTCEPGRNAWYKAVLQAAKEYAHQLRV
jgi:orotidine-5'-phosphate decarboxylase